ncbi:MULTISPECIES: TspO/MBR family protein [unclassified Novosphingobium]|uniref:TspO/MBR family protein n=1 Tax=Novosphingobium TaxID=165696 RepID=UPI0014468F54|nr:MULTISPECIES: TspO/MBR family protein [unclassified Novosphingobium]NKJ41021.1 tryptophan-rich sensory protein [Novosphingobium sp. SG720]NMN03268.1 tryptophan-rich sensory protein [Novosphingobium sp. SG919]NMN86742.1 tryptophan-rich sensory protein [Novosphingobium sp. SG916]
MRYLASPAQLRASLVRWSLFTIPLVLGLGFLSGRSAGSGPSNPWFAALVKPATFPPPATFGIVWSVLYLLMGLALAMILAARGAPGRPGAVAAFVVQLLLNLSWSPVFFALHRMMIAQGIILAMIPLVALTIFLFWRVRPAAAWLLVPYLAWICFAAFLNFQFIQLNPDADGAAVPQSTVHIDFGQG